MQRPSLEQIAQRLVEIAYAEGVRGITLPLAKDIARRSGCDVRQSINELQFMLKGDLSILAAKNDSTGITMDRTFNPFDSVSALFGCHPRDCVRLADQVYESDSMLGPLLIHENYAKVANLSLDGMSDVADAISEGDFIEGAGRRSSGVLADARAVMMCAMPCVLSGAKIEGHLDFPGFLGKSSTITGNNLAVLDVAQRALCPRQGFATETLPFLHKIAVEPLTTIPSQSKSAIPAIAALLRSMNLTRVDWNMICDLGRIRVMTVPPTAKAALTREMGGSEDKKQKKPPAKRARVAKPQKKEKK